jgi:hypothetical protein
MATYIGFHEVDDVDHWLHSPKRQEFFGPMGITGQLFTDTAKSDRVGHPDRSLPRISGGLPQGPPLVPTRVGRPAWGTIEAIADRLLQDAAAGQQGGGLHGGDRRGGGWDLRAERGNAAGRGRPYRDGTGAGPWAAASDSGAGLGRLGAERRQPVPAAPLLSRPLPDSAGGGTARGAAGAGRGRRPAHQPDR